MCSSCPKGCVRRQHNSTHCTSDGTESLGEAGKRQTQQKPPKEHTHTEGEAVEEQLPHTMRHASVRWSVPRVGNACMCPRRSLRVRTHTHTKHTSHAILCRQEMKHCTGRQRVTRPTDRPTDRRTTIENRETGHQKEKQTEGTHENGVEQHTDGRNAIQQLQQRQVCTQAVRGQQ